MTRRLRFKITLDLRLPARVRPTLYVSDDEGDLVFAAFGSALALKIEAGRSW